MNPEEYDTIITMLEAQMAKYRDQPEIYGMIKEQLRVFTEHQSKNS